MNLFLKSITVLFLLTLAFIASAIADNSPSLHVSGDTENSMVWPMLPGESIESLAAKFYPKSPTLQKAFIRKTKRLSAANIPNLTSSDRFKYPTAIVIPTLQSISAMARPIRKPKKHEALRLSYNIKSTIERIPESLYREYDDLVNRNEFLKVELEKLNQRLAFLKNRMSELRLIFERTLRASVENKSRPQTSSDTESKAKVKPAPKKLKNLQEQPTKQEQQTKGASASKPNKAKVAAEASMFAKLKSQLPQWLNMKNKILWFSLLGLALLVALVFYLLKKQKEKEPPAFSTYVSSHEDSAAYNVASNNAKEGDVTDFNASDELETIVEDHQERTMLNEAKEFVRQNKVDDAVSHLKWAIRSKPKVNINLWLYLLSLLKTKNEKEDFERFASEVNQQFNVMKPQWDEHVEAAIVIPASLEEFPHILQKLTELWPNDSARDYLNSLVNDNREGERLGFSQEVIEEILVLVDVVETRNSFWEIKGSV